MELERLVHNNLDFFFLIFVYFFLKNTFPRLITRKLEQTHFEGSQVSLAVFCSECQGDHRIITKGNI